MYAGILHIVIDGKWIIMDDLENTAICHNESVRTKYQHSELLV